MWISDQGADLGCRPSFDRVFRPRELRALTIKRDASIASSVLCKVLSNITASARARRLVKVQPRLVKAQPRVFSRGLVRLIAVDADIRHRESFGWVVDHF